MPKVSVIIPAYNQAKYLEDALNSVRNQTFEDWECIIVNDGSTDNTEEIAKNYAKMDKRFKYIYQENKGLAGARNTGIKTSQGEYIGFLDSDDLWYLEMLMSTVNYFKDHLEIDFVHGAWDYIDEDGRTISPVIKPVVRKDYLKELIMENLFPANAILVRRKCFEHCGLFDESLSALEDWEMWVRLAAHGHRMRCVYNPAARYRRHRGCMTLDIERMKSNYFKVLGKIFDGMKLPPPLLELRPHAYIFQWLDLAGYCMEAGEIQKLKQCLKEATNLYKNAPYNSVYAQRYLSLVAPMHFNKEFVSLVAASMPIFQRHHALAKIRLSEGTNEYTKGNYIRALYSIIDAFIIWPPVLIDVAYFPIRLIKYRYIYSNSRRNKYIKNK